MNLSSTIKSIQDIMRKDDGVDGDAQRIGQLTWMLFLKIFDQCEETWEDDAEDRGEHYRSSLPDQCRWRSWAAYKDGKPQVAANELIAYVNNRVFPRLKDLPIENDPRAKVVREVFVDANNYMKSSTLMLGVIEKLDEAINFHDIKARGQLGDLYEQILNDLLLHGIEAPSMIEHRNTLAKGWNDWRRSERVDCVITNPPFGGMEEDNVGNDFPSDIQTRETADMFLVLIVKKLLKEKGGRGALVLPDGTLFGEGVKAKIKELLMRECHLHTIVRLPNGVFSPYTGIKTNLLFFTRGKPTDSIWFYEHRYPEGVKSYSKTKPLRIEELQPIADWWGEETDGFKARVETEQAWRVDFKQLKEDATAKAQPHWDKAEAINNQAAALNEQAKALRASIRGEKRPTVRKPVEEQLDELSRQIDKLRQQAKNEQAAGDRHYWPIYNLDSKNPNAAEEESQDPDILLAKYKKLLGEIEETENQLRDELAEALSHHFETEESAR